MDKIDGLVKLNFLYPQMPLLPSACMNAGKSQAQLPVNFPLLQRFQVAFTTLRLLLQATEKKVTSAWCFQVGMFRVFQVV